MSTKSTLLFNKEDDWHFYRDFAKPRLALEVDDKIVDLPMSFLEAVKDLVFLHENFKGMIGLSKKLDLIDGGLFMINTKEGTVKEYKGEKNLEDKK